MNKVNKKLKKYLDTLPQKEANSLKAKIMDVCSLTTNAIDNRLYGRTFFKELEKEKISEIIGLPIEKLF